MSIHITYTAFVKCQARGFELYKTTSSVSLLVYEYTILSENAYTRSVTMPIVNLQYATHL